MERGKGGGKGGESLQRWYWLNDCRKKGEAEKFSACIRSFRRERRGGGGGGSGKKNDKMVPCAVSNHKTTGKKRGREKDHSNQTIHTEEEKKTDQAN